MLFCGFKSLCRRVPGTGTAYTEELAVSGVQEGEDEFSKKVCETQAKPGIQISCKKCNGLYCWKVLSLKIVGRGGGKSRRKLVFKDNERKKKRAGGLMKEKKKPKQQKKPQTKPNKAAFMPENLKK